MSAHQGFDRELYANMLAGIESVAANFELSTSGLLDFIPRISPTFERPEHMAPLARLFERAVAGEPVRAVFSAPPQHGKTEIALHGIAWALSRAPSIPFVYATYGADLSLTKSDRARGLARLAGVEISSTSDSKKEWLTRSGGGLRATGVGGPLTGNPAQIALVDDPYKNRVDAESSAYRRRVEQWFDDVLMTRVAPGGSVIVWATRWTPNDLSGKLIADGWEHVRLPAIEDRSLEAFEAVEKAVREATDPTILRVLQAELARLFDALVLLWPSRWRGRVMELLARRANAYTWASLYQGKPRPRGGTVFHDVYRYDELPTVAYTDALGTDFAYAAKTSSDSSALVHFRRVGDLLYVVHALKQKVDAATWMQRIAAYQQANGQPPCGWYASSTEYGAAVMGSGFGASVTPMPARSGDKFVRAQPYATSWNGGRVLVPSSSPPWLDSFLESHLNFTGVGDEDDDEVDAGAAGHDLLAPGGVFASSEVDDEGVGRRMHVERRGGGDRLGSRR